MENYEADKAKNKHSRNSAKARKNFIFGGGCCAVRIVRVSALVSRRPHERDV